MSQKPKETDAAEPEEKTSDNRSYYYDDAHGYKEYDPDAEELDDDPEESA